MQGPSLLLVAAAACLALLLDAAIVSAAPPASATHALPPAVAPRTSDRRAGGHVALVDVADAAALPPAPLASPRRRRRRRLARRASSRRPLAPNGGASNGGGGSGSNNRGRTLTRVQLDGLPNYGARVDAVTSVYLYFFVHMVGEPDPRPTRQAKADVAYKFCLERPPETIPLERRGRLLHEACYELVKTVHHVPPSPSLVRITKELLDTTTAAEREADAAAAEAALAAAAAADKEAATSQPETAHAGRDGSDPAQSDQRTYGAQQPPPTTDRRVDAPLPGHMAVNSAPLSRAPHARWGAGSVRGAFGNLATAGNSLLKSVASAGAGDSSQTGQSNASGPGGGSGSGPTWLPQRMFTALAAGARAAFHSAWAPPLGGGANGQGLGRALPGSGGGGGGLGAMRGGGFPIGGIRRW